MDSANSISATAGDNLEARAWKLAMEKETIDLTMLEFISGSIRPWPGHLYTRGRTPLSKNLSCARIFSFLPRRLLALGTPSSVACTTPPAPLALRAFTGRAPCSPSRRVCRAARAGTPRPVASSHVTTEAPRAADGTALPPPSGTGEALTRCRLVEFVQVLVLVDFLKSSRAHSSPDYLGKIEGNSFQIPGFPISQCSSFEVISLSEKLYLVS